MLFQFPRSFIGYSSRSVAAAFAQCEAGHAHDLARLRKEIGLARERTAELHRQLVRLEAELKTAESRVQAEMLVTLQAQGQGQQVLQAAAMRHADQQRLLLEQIEKREAVLTQLQRLQAGLATELRQLVEHYQGSLSTVGTARIATGPAQAPAANQTQVKPAEDSA